MLDCENTTVLLYDSKQERRCAHNAHLLGVSGTSLNLVGISRARQTFRKIMGIQSN